MMRIAGILPAIMIHGFPRLLSIFTLICVPMLAPGVYAIGTGTVERTINIGDIERSYLLHAPRALSREAAMPLVLVFHGGGGKPAQIERDSKFSELAERHAFLVAYPAGIGKSWNDGRDSDRITAQRDKVDDLAFVSALIDDVARTHNVDAKRIYATGISNGGIFSHYLAANLSSRIAAIAPVVGGMPVAVHEAFKPTHPVSLLVLSGTSDPLVPYDGGDVTVFGRKRGKIVSTETAVRTWVQHDRCDTRATVEDLPDIDVKDDCRVQRFTYANGRDGTEVVLLKMIGAGHAWPGGSQYLPRRRIGSVCRDINATGVIWEFFRTHSKTTPKP